jgi:hypothetical protein
MRRPLFVQRSRQRGEFDLKLRHPSPSRNFASSPLIPLPPDTVLRHWRVLAHIRRVLAHAAHTASISIVTAVIVASGVGVIQARCQEPQSGQHIFGSLHGVHVVGYQGWFDCPEDGAGVGWGHWFVANSNTKDPNSIAFDEWPDTSELSPGERCPTDFRLPSGAPAYLFSDQNPWTVARHFRWMKDYGIDGAAMQRFTVSLSNPPLARHFDAVLRNARVAAEANGRGFFVMYDISGMNGAAALRTIMQDWPHLTGDLRLTGSPAYIYDRGKPVVGVWGLGFKDRDVTPEQAAAIIRFLKTTSVAATVLGGVPASWRNLGADSLWPDARPDERWAAVYRSLDVISPWATGRFRDDRGADNFARLRIVPDLAEAHRLGIEYMPVLFPGYSFYHAGRSRGLNLPLNSIPRRCGEFYRRQMSNALKAGVDMLYTAMFDEVNEGTAIFKLAATKAQAPVGTDLIALDADGCRTATSDTYLRIAGEASRALQTRR